MDDELLRYRYLNNFDAEMNRIGGKFGWLEAEQVNKSFFYASFD